MELKAPLSRGYADRMARRGGLWFGREIDKEKTEMADPRAGRWELLDAKNSLLILMDYQASMFKWVASGDNSIIKIAARGAAKAASTLGIPVVLSSIHPESNGPFIPEIAALFPDQKLFSRKILSFDAFDDRATWNAVKKTGRRKIVVSGLG